MEDSQQLFVTKKLEDIEHNIKRSQELIDLSSVEKLNLTVFILILSLSITIFIIGRGVYSVEYMTMILSIYAIISIFFQSWPIYTNELNERIKTIAYLGQITIQFSIGITIMLVNIIITEIIEHQNYTFLVVGVLFVICMVCYLCEYGPKMAEANIMNKLNERFPLLVKEYKIND
jgi:hypothetical protein